MTETPIFRSRGGLAALIVAGLLLLIGLTQSATEPQPTDGPPGSSYATHDAGVAALASLLESNGYRVERVRTPLATRPPSPNDVVIVINGGSLEPDDVDTLVEHVSSGGRLVTAGSTQLVGLVDSAPNGLTVSNKPSGPLLPVGDFAAITTVSTGWVWEDAGSLLPLVGNDDGTMVGIEYIDSGSVIGIADDRVLGNGLLDESDHALLALLAVGETDGTVRFVEYIHGFTQPTGLAALPSRWKQALLVLALAGAVWLIARGRRFGPAEDSSRGLPPPRSAYLDAVAATLEASGDPLADAPLVAAINAELARRGADLGSSTTLVDVAIQAGADRNIVEQALGPGTRHDDVRARTILLSHLVNKEQL